MRIVAGDWRGRRLVAPKGRGVRPTLEKVREAIFDVLGPKVTGAFVLDLFAGCGAMGFEALSRGAAHVTWCDSSARSVEAIRQNMSRLCVPGEKGRVLHTTAISAIELLSQEGKVFDLVFVDPPYESEHYEETLLFLGMGRLLSDNGVVVVEHSKRMTIEPVFGSLMISKRRVYGETGVAFFVRSS